MTFPFIYTPYFIWANVNYDFKYPVFVKIESKIGPGPVPFLFRFARLFVNVPMNFLLLQNVPQRSQRWRL